MAISRYGSHDQDRRDSTKRTRGTGGREKKTEVRWQCDRAAFSWPASAIASLARSPDGLRTFAFQVGFDRPVALTRETSLRPSNQLVKTRVTPVAYVCTLIDPPHEQLIVFHLLRHKSMSVLYMRVAIACPPIGKESIRPPDESQGVLPVLGRRAAAGSSVRRGMAVGDAGSLGSS